MWYQRNLVGAASRFVADDVGPARMFAPDLVFPIQMEPAAPTASLHSAVRKAASALRSLGPETSTQRLAVCKALLEGDEVGSGLRDALNALSLPERYYWVSALYMLLMPSKRRQRLAAYFTPPHLCSYVLDRLEHFGVNFCTDIVLDPASGGAAFLVPWALRYLKMTEMAGWDSERIVSQAKSQLAGVEIEPGLARLSELLLSDLFRSHLQATGENDLGVIERGNSLKGRSQTGKFDVVVGNPPYGRVFRPSASLKSRWSEIIADGHVNTYALFVASSIEAAVPGGVISLIIPTSFVGGPYFSKLRSYILNYSNVLELSLIEKRSEAFIDVIQDTCVLILRKKGARRVDEAPRCSVIRSDGTTEFLGNLGALTEGGVHGQSRLVKGTYPLNGITMRGSPRLLTMAMTCVPAISFGTDQGIAWLIE